MGEINELLLVYHMMEHPKAYGSSTLIFAAFDAVRLANMGCTDALLNLEGPHGPITVSEMIEMFDLQQFVQEVPA